MLSFERFLQGYLKNEYNSSKLNATIIKHGFIKFNAYHYYIREYKKDFFEIMINQIDDWTAIQGSPINFAEKIVESIITDHSMQNLNNIKFTIITRDGIKESDYHDFVKNQKSKSIAKFQRHIISNFTEIKDCKDFNENQYIYIDSDILYNSLEKCHHDFVMIQLFLNSLKKKFDAQDANQKHIHEYYELSEQTFYSWKKKNPKLFQAILDGYFYKDVKDIVYCLSTMQELLSETWASYEPMKHQDGEEF